MTEKSTGLVLPESSDFQYLTTSEAGINWAIQRDGDQIRIKAEQDITALLENNRAQYNHNDGWSKSRELRRAAFVPDIIAKKWLDEEGWWYLDPNCKHKLKQKLNSSEYLYLRTAPGRL